MDFLQQRQNRISSLPKTLSPKWTTGNVGSYQYAGQAQQEADAAQPTYARFYELINSLSQPGDIADPNRIAKFFEATALAEDLRKRGFWNAKLAGTLRGARGSVAIPEKQNFDMINNPLFSIETKKNNVDNSSYAAFNPTRRTRPQIRLQPLGMSGVGQYNMGVPLRMIQR